MMSKLATKNKYSWPKWNWIIIQVGTFKKIQSVSLGVKKKRKKQSLDKKPDNLDLSFYHKGVILNKPV